MELARVNSLAEAEMRLGRDLVEDLLAGIDGESTLARARALGYDLERPHRVLIVEARRRTTDARLFHDAVQRGVARLLVGSLLLARDSKVYVLADADRPWERLRAVVADDLRGGSCRIGVGGWAARPDEIARSCREARFALRIQGITGAADGVTQFDELGIYRMLAGIEDPGDVERFVRGWLGALLDYDADRHSELVPTLSRYLESGGRYDATSSALGVHRSTLKYRLKRIGEISGHDLSDPDIHFNLHMATRAWHTLAALRGGSP
jgi:sugar diacid utilization regulator